MDMRSVATLSPRELDVRARIVETAEALFRDIGYQKTTVADIAKALRMSPANVYRFFDSKKSINEAVAERWGGGVVGGRGGRRCGRWGWVWGRVGFNDRLHGPGVGGGALV